MAEQLIEEQLKNRNICKDESVDELYLVHGKLKEMCNLSQFKHLNRLWLSFNKLRKVHWLSANFRLNELYLDNNMLVDLNGALRHLSCLRVLTLHNNQLTNLNKVLEEFNKMHCLRHLTLFHNPLAQERGYRLFLIHSVPSLEALDHQRVKPEERVAARDQYCEHNRIMSTRVAFLLSSPARTCLTLPSIKPSKGISKGGQTQPYVTTSPAATMEDAYEKRRAMFGTNMFTVLDWSALPREQVRRLGGDELAQPQLITHVFR